MIPVELQADRDFFVVAASKRFVLEILKRIVGVIRD
jgi:hypothetical protein